MRDSIFDMFEWLILESSALMRVPRETAAAWLIMA